MSLSFHIEKIYPVQRQEDGTVAYFPLRFNSDLGLVTLYELRLNEANGKIQMQLPSLPGDRLNTEGKPLSQEIVALDKTARKEIEQEAVRLYLEATTEGGPETNPSQP